MAVLKNTVNIGDMQVTGDLTASKVKVQGGTSAQAMMANGTLTTLSTVASTGSYNDLTDKPSIPSAANSGTLQISSNSNSAVDTLFNANSSSATNAIKFVQKGATTVTAAAANGSNPATVTISSTDTKNTTGVDRVANTTPLCFIGTISTGAIGSNTTAQTYSNTEIVAKGSQLSAGTLSASRLISTTYDYAPLKVSSSILVDNLNADLLDGKHANAISDIYTGAYSALGNAHACYGRVAEFKYPYTLNGSSKIDASATFLISKYDTLPNSKNVVNILNIRIRVEQTQQDDTVTITSKNNAAWVLNTYNDIPITITYIYENGNYYVRIYFKSAGWGQVYGCKLLNSHSWASTNMTNWTMWRGYGPGDDSHIFGKIPEPDTNKISITTPTLNNNAATASKWKTARDIAIGDTTKSLDGSSNLTWTLDEIGAAAAADLDNYLLLVGGTMKGPITARNIYTTHNSYDLGTPNARWRNIYSVKTYASTGFFQSSDARKKNVIGDLDLNKAYELIDKCQTILYTLKDDPSNKQEIGLIAQEVREIFPELISEDEAGMLSLDYARLTVIILKVLKDLISRISKLEASK